MIETFFQQQNSSKPVTQHVSDSICNANNGHDRSSFLIKLINDQDLIHLWMHFDGDSQEKWHQGMTAFMENDWDLNHILNRLDGNDSPSKYILNYIK